ncbi:Iron-sulfur cluster carrier protein [uncultured archaeon]|nr:Iron-sulfur cluster carrier protein [uncultured archaeon]
MVAKTIGILSLKGGVGKTSTSVALGSAISELGRKVLLVDGNLSAPNLGLHLNIHHPELTLHHVLRGEANIRDAITDIGGLDVLPASILNKSKTNPLKLRDKLNYIKHDYDFILIDGSPSLNEETLAVILAADELLVVTTPDLPTLEMTIKAVNIAKQRDTPIAGLIVNKVHNKRFEIPLRQIEKNSGVPVLAVIPHDINMLRALSQYKPYTEYKAYSEGSREFRKLAASLLGEKCKSFDLKGLFRFTPTLQDVNREIFYESVFQ